MLMRSGAVAGALAALAGAMMAFWAKCWMLSAEFERSTLAEGAC